MEVSFPMFPADTVVYEFVEQGKKDTEEQTELVGR